MIPVFLADATPSAPSVMDGVFDAASNLFDLGMTVFDKICSNPILAIFVGASVISLVLTVIKKTRKSVK